MPRIHLCFLWHMHQPFYKNLISGEYKLPWTRLHALKDYYGMAKLLDEFPAVRQTFNLVPSMMVQVEDYAGSATDPYLDAALAQAESMSGDQRHFLLANSFHAHPPRMIRRYPRYGELYDAWLTHRGQPEPHRFFSGSELRDLQVLSQLAWFDEEFQAEDPLVRELLAKGRHYTLEDQQRAGQKQREIIGKVLPVYERLAASGQIEISTTPFYHPILPLVCDSNIASVSHPGMPLPPRFRYPQDARAQLEMARRYVTERFGASPAGLWPSEGSVSDEVFTAAADAGFAWTATDSGVLSRTLDRTAGVHEIYRPYRWMQNGRQLDVIFRDHFLSDLIGFVYARMGAAEAARDFVSRIRENCRGILDSGRDALVPIILDGENAWEYYEQNGRPFLRELYGLLSEDGEMSAVTVSEGLSRIEPEPMHQIFPGSWINANFDIWIGYDEDNRAWEQLLRAREAYEGAGELSPEQRSLAYEELLIAEGSDWCWWYGPHHDSAQRPEFDQLYRSHLTNVYRALGQVPPEELSRPILGAVMREEHVAPTGPVTAVIDGEVTSYFEWLAAAAYRVDERSGSMHGKRLMVHQVLFGSDHGNLYVRVDFRAGVEELLPETEVRLVIESAGQAASALSLCFRDGAAVASDVRMAGEGDVEYAFSRVLELRVPLSAARAGAGSDLRLKLSRRHGGLPMDAVPQDGWLQVSDGDGWPL